MKWREPWKESIKQQAASPQFWRRLLRGLVVWYAAFAVLVIVYALLGKIASQDVPSRLSEVLLYAAAMSVLLYLAWFLSPRKVDSGPRGIVLTKSDELLLIPWQAIASFEISRPVLPGTLLLRLHSGEECAIVLPYGASPTEISREIAEMNGAQV